MGVVYLAEDTLLGRHVAIKTLTIKPGQNSQHFRTRFLREARAVSALSHPNIATIHDYGEINNEPYIVMEFVRGETLGDKMLAESLTITQTLNVIAQVADALAEAHRNGVVHRDVKPSNVAINHRGEVKVLDFGLAKQLNVESLNSNDPERQTLLTSQTQEGVIVGTPLYLSPEQALGAEIDARSDIFSLGTLLYECVAGKPPFDGTGKMDICTKVIRDDPVPPSKINENVPEEINRIVLKALAKKPGDRYQTADAMADELRTAQVRIDSSALNRAVPRLTHAAAGRPTGTLATLSDIFRRPRVSLGYVIAAVIVLALAGIVIWRVTRPIPYQPHPEAKRLYDLAVNALREGAFFKSSKILQQAVATDDRFALAHARLAEAWSELDSSDQAKDEFIRANDLVPNRGVLAEDDALRLQAIGNTLKRDFAAAIADYRQLTTRGVPGEHAFALVDLGRAYEKNDQWDKAVESYKEATKTNEHYAAAYLRLGVALQHNQKYADADAAFAQASSLFGVSNEVEGVTEVLYQRGILLIRQGKTDEAQAAFQQALQRSEAIENNDQRIRTLQQMSYASVMSGNSERARQYSQQAMQLAESNRMQNLTTSGLIDIGNSYFIKGDFAEAEKNYYEAIRLAQLYKGKFNEARGLLALAGARRAQDDPDTARDYAQRSLAFFQQGGYGKQVFIANQIIGHAYNAVGDYDAAEKIFTRLLQNAQQVGDERTVALAEEGLGLVFLNTDRLPEALTQFNGEYEHAKTMGARIMLANAAINRADAYSRLGRYDESARDADEALGIAAPPGAEPHKDLQSNFILTSAVADLSQHRNADAAAKAQQVLSIAGSNYKETAITARSVLGLAQALSGKGAAGMRNCQEAVAGARSLRNPQVLSQALLALAQAALAAGDAQTALNAATEAQQRFTSSKQNEFEWRAFAIEARAAEKLSQTEKARQLGSQALSIMSQLEQAFGSDNYQTYLKRPDVAELRAQLAIIGR